MSAWGPEDIERWWCAVDCDGLFLIFDTSANVNGGEPDVSVDEVLTHVRDCRDCQDAGHDSVSEDSDGMLTLHPF